MNIQVGPCPPVEAAAAEAPLLKVIVLTAVFFLKLVQCQPRLNRKIRPFMVEWIRFNHT